jgi:hypothetical protein
VIWKRSVIELTEFSPRIALFVGVKFFCSLREGKSPPSAPGVPSGSAEGVPRSSEPAAGVALGVKPWERRPVGSYAGRLGGRAARGGVPVREGLTASALPLSPVRPRISSIWLSIAGVTLEARPSKRPVGSSVGRLGGRAARGGVSQGGSDSQRATSDANQAADFLYLSFQVGDKSAPCHPCLWAS